MLLWDYHRAVRHNALDPSKRGEEIMKKLILLTLSIVSFNNYAVDFVYRVDSTPPDVFFAMGFHYLGITVTFSNLSVEGHVVVEVVTVAILQQPQVLIKHML